MPPVAIFQLRPPSRGERRQLHQRQLARRATLMAEAEQRNAEVFAGWQRQLACQGLPLPAEGLFQQSSPSWTAKVLGATVLIQAALLLPRTGSVMGTSPTTEIQALVAQIFLGLAIILGWQAFKAYQTLPLRRFARRLRQGKIPWPEGLLVSVSSEWSILTEKSIDSIEDLTTLERDFLRQARLPSLRH